MDPPCLICHSPSVTFDPERGQVLLQSLKKIIQIDRSDGNLLPKFCQTCATLSTKVTDLCKTKDDLEKDILHLQVKVCRKVKELSGMEKELREVVEEIEARKIIQHGREVNDLKKKKIHQKISMVVPQSEIMEYDEYFEEGVKTEPLSDYEEGADEICDNDFVKMNPSEVQYYDEDSGSSVDLDPLKEDENEKTEYTFDQEIIPEDFPVKRKRGRPPKLKKTLIEDTPKKYEILPKTINDSGKRGKQPKDKKITKNKIKSKKKKSNDLSNYDCPETPKVENKLGDSTPTGSGRPIRNSARNAMLMNKLKEEKDLKSGNDEEYDPEFYSNQKSSEEEEANSDSESEESDDSEEEEVNKVLKRRGRGRPPKSSSTNNTERHILGELVKTKAGLSFQNIPILKLNNSYKCTNCEMIFPFKPRPSDLPNKKRGRPCKDQFDPEIFPNLEIPIKKEEIKMAERKIKVHINGIHLEMYKCKECPDHPPFNSYEALSYHTKRHSNSILQCPICTKPYKERDSFKAHVWSHKNKEEQEAALASGQGLPQSCQRYIKSTDRPLHPPSGHFRKILRDIKVFSPRIPKKKIVILPGVLEVENPLKEPSLHRLGQIEVSPEGTESYEHIALTRTQDSITCSSCSTQFNYDPTKKAAERKLMQHIRAEHLSSYVCKMCPNQRKFGSYESLRLHMKSHLAPIINCPTCQAPYKDHQSLRGHLWTHFNAQEHQEALARGKKPPRAKKILNPTKSFQCSQCGRTCSTLKQLKSHEVSHIDKELRKTHQCPQCGKLYSSALSLRLHLKYTHDRANNLRHQCPHCEKKFALTQALNDHIRVHTGEKPFTCQTCQKSFRTKEVMKLHQVTHTGEKKYPCDICGKRFGWPAHKIRHMATLHNN